MADVTIALTLDTIAPPFDLAVSLDGVEYGVRVQYNARDAAWFLSLRDAAGSLLVGSQPMIESFPLLSRHKATATGMPQGDLYLQGSTLIYREAAA